MDPIKYIYEKPALTGNIARWQVALLEYDIVHVTQKAIKGSALANHLAHNPLVDYQPMKHDFLDNANGGTRKIKGWVMYFDGASNTLGHCIRAVLISQKGHWFPFTMRVGFNCTNNMVEYEAYAMGIIKDLKVHGDSTLLIHQLKGEWETQDVKLIPYYSYIGELVEHFEKIMFHHTPQEENQMVDALATLASMFEVSQESDTVTLFVHHRTIPAYCQAIKEEADGKPWYYDIKQYLKNKEYPPNATTIIRKR
ncbi:hypothetical protein CR513_09242, partial [Mucuna pruriens]